MPESIQARLVILLNTASTVAPASALTALRYAATAAAMDVAVEVHAVSQSAALFGQGAADAELSEQIGQAVLHGVEIFVCPLALAALGLDTQELVAEVSGVRGAASLLAAGLEPGGRFMVF